MKLRPWEKPCSECAVIRDQSACDIETHVKRYKKYTRLAMTLTGASTPGAALEHIAEHLDGALHRLHVYNRGQEPWKGEALIDRDGLWET